MHPPSSVLKHLLVAKSQSLMLPPEPSSADTSTLPELLRASATTGRLCPSKRCCLPLGAITTIAEPAGNIVA